jgi:peroxiredoxin
VADAVQVGQEAPDFTLRDDEGQDFTLSSQRGKTVVLMFYPHDFSPVCEGEMCSVRDAWSDWEETGATVIGISRDSIWAHRAWKQQQGFKQKLLADMKGEVARLYGAWNEERGNANRKTIVIDKEGRITALDQTEHAGIARDMPEMMAAARAAAV